MTTIYERERLTQVEPRAIVEQMVGAVTIERCLVSVTAYVVANGRRYTGRGVTARMACWALMRSLAVRQLELEDCL